MKYFIVLLFFITDFLFSQEAVSFDDFDTDDYEYGIMYIEMKNYTNNIRMVNKNKNLVKEIPVIKKYSNKDNIIYAFTGYIIDDENNVSIINVKLKLLDSGFVIQNELSRDFNIVKNEIPKLIENMQVTEDYITGGKDKDGSFTLHKKILVKDSYEIEDSFSMIYAYILFSNFSSIDPDNISRRLMYYIMEFTY
jgi:hypothetical protein